MQSIRAELARCCKCIQLHVYSMDFLLATRNETHCADKKELDFIDCSLN